MKFFNKQRSKLMAGKKINKYLKYAFGEIILVVLGILIAVGINNWNQRKQLNAKSKDLKNQVIAELKSDITTIANYQKKIDTIQQRFLKILGKEYDETMTKRSDFIASLLFEPNVMNLDDTVINLIDNANLNDSKASKTLLNLSSSYKSHTQIVEDLEQLIFSKMNENLKEIEQTQSWYTDFITDFNCANECIEFLLHDERHKARMASLRFLEVNVYGQTLKTMRVSLQQYLDELEIE
ncbi:hypothetical protein [Kordia sp.]|uniref:hypothetical protein n=1 Tax=Kordia sp. TaxID=1965332 RepID=UPI003D284CA3